MKKLYALAFAAFICSFADAQVKKGDIVLGGNLQYSNNNQQSPSGTSTPYTYNSHTLIIAPTVGEVVKDNLVLGFDISYTNSRTEYSGPGNINGNGFGAGVFVRKYRPLGNGFYLFGQSRIGGGYIHNGQDEPAGNQPISDVTNSFSFALQFFPGIAYALNPKWQLEAGLPSFFSINYSNYKETQTFTTQPDAHYNGHNFSVQSSLTGNNTLTVGVRYFIGS